MIGKIIMFKPIITKVIMEKSMIIKLIRAKPTKKIKINMVQLTIFK
jgi:hypothetical protein